MYVYQSLVPSNNRSVSVACAVEPVITRRLTGTKEWTLGNYRTGKIE